MSPRHYYTPVPAYTGAAYQQPSREHLHVSPWAHTPDFRDSVDCSGFIDAPELIPSGSVRAQDGEHITLGLAAHLRPGWHS